MARLNLGLAPHRGETDRNGQDHGRYYRAGAGEFCVSGAVLVPERVLDHTDQRLGEDVNNPGETYVALTNSGSRSSWSFALL